MTICPLPSDNKIDSGLPQRCREVAADLPLNHPLRHSLLRNADRYDALLPKESDLTIELLKLNTDLKELIPDSMLAAAEWTEKWHAIEHQINAVWDLRDGNRTELHRLWDDLDSDLRKAEGK
jgi:hypothetical protein